MFLNLGCGRDYREGWENWDNSHEVKADVYLDCGKEIFPVPDEHFEVIYCSGVLEQILTNDELRHCLNECWRVLEVGKEMTIIVPNAKYSIAFRDPNDVRQFTEGTFKYFDQKTQEYMLYGSVYGYRGWNLRSTTTNSRGILTAVLQKP